MAMKNFDELVKINHNPNQPYIPDHPCRILQFLKYLNLFHHPYSFT